MAKTGDASLSQASLKPLVGYQLRRADIAMRQAFSRHIGEPFGLRPVEFAILTLLADNERVTHKQLSEALDVAPSNMVAVVAKLKKSGLLARARNPDDGRSIVLALTREGRDLETRARSAVTAMEDQLLGAWDAGDREHLLAMLDRFRG
ncbi:MarR family winged helix-turn-helix transcriptional regulator [Salinisphaera aquimarina]|uniref:MarR family winged helix-turn-helix transcriptional regulator n=1 Tax=Salinisphaera aquimarina TaxID=2094031 RepID=A0ABV7ENA8_9GAMM